MRRRAQLGHGHGLGLGFREKEKVRGRERQGLGGVLIHRGGTAATSWCDGDVGDELGRYSNGATGRR